MTVVFESGLAANRSWWALVQELVAAPSVVDGVGFVNGLSVRGYDPARARAFVVGAGGAGAAAVLAAGAELVGLVDVDQGRAAGVVSHLDEHWPGRAAVGAAFGHAGLVVNATPLGMRSVDPLPFDPNELASHAVVADIIMRPKGTPLLRAAAEAGYRVHHGHHMLDEQIPLYRDFFCLSPA
ncbi:shikimate 5-dehydrogenase [Actinokineospora baliensis]|uniref:hypothetical protein n=1 Tax=Actinokineospora baliensis TaxID=547056 RepID=UPI001956EA2D|nr:hypothetical protein [Actinokineospora baliensis]MBM7774338.1 shikimate 5-dehydrogenase [Actinokineospora baliensis]